MKKWLLTLVSENHEVSSTRVIMVLTVLFVFGMAIATIFTGRFNTDVAWFLSALFSIVVLNKTAHNFKPQRPPNSNSYGSNSYGSNSYGSSSYNANSAQSFDDERG